MDMVKILLHFLAAVVWIVAIGMYKGDDLFERKKDK